MSPPLESAAPAPSHLDRVRALTPLIAASAAEIERERRLPAALVAAMKAADLFRMLLPRSLGGAELDPVRFAAVIEAIAKTDASTAWVLCQTSVAAMIAARLDPAAAREMFPDPGSIVAWGPSTGARAVIVSGGYRVSGSFAFASGCWYASWLGGDCAVCDPDGTPRRAADGRPVTRRVLFPSASAQMRDVWHVIGLKGTGSDGYVVTDLFVPDRFTVSRIDDPADRRDLGHLYAVSLYSMFALGFAALALGIARGLIDSFIELAKEKTPRGFRHSLRDDGPTQLEAGLAEARLRAARMYLMGTIAEVWDEAQRANEVSLERRIGIRLAATHAIREAKDVADAAYDAAGTTAVFNANPFERRFRDIHTLAQQLQGRRSHYQTVGQYLFGVDFEPGWV
ncbi:MAG TPA: acyl-CoA dehydrogenase family protein [Stellaceae bacterium]|nr:acyl-CoA dehydrogenase family protein [Stellaceae bacterium]